MDHDNTHRQHASNGAEAILIGLKVCGVEYLFANAGTDFAPIIEAFCRLDSELVPRPVTVPHETAAIAMAHGYYLSSGRPQAAMVHVNVGLANAAMGIINAASDNIPMIVLSGRTPLTEGERPGSRITPIQYGQEMYEQSALVAEATKFRYEMRYPEQGGPLAARAMALATSAPSAPVYIGLPREPLMQPIEDSGETFDMSCPAAARSEPDAAAIALAARWLADAEAPLVLCQRGDPHGVLAEQLERFCERHAVAVAEPFVVRNVMASAHPMFLGHDVEAALEGADLVIVLDSQVPWIERLHRPSKQAKVVHIGPDPHFQRMPMRGHRVDLAIASDPAAAIAALDVVLDMTQGEPGEVVVKRTKALAKRSSQRRVAARAKAEAGCTAPMSAEWLSLCLSQAMDDRAVVFSELGVVPGAMQLAGANQLFCNPHSGGLGWAIPAALGAQLADRRRLTVACVGDGSYIFANPVACHQIAEALELPILTIIKNNGLWNAVRRSVVNAYPDGAAVRANQMPLTSLEPAPDYLMVAAASRAHTERVEHGRDLPAALERAIAVIRGERRQAVLDVQVAVADAY
jgi:acetolactate synthase-1/2/3 large subunit